MALAPMAGEAYVHRRDARERDEAERNRACGGNPKEREGDARERNRACVRPPKQDRRICQTDNLKEKAKKGDLYGKIIIYFRIGYRGTSR